MSRGRPAHPWLGHLKVRILLAARHFGRLPFPLLRAFGHAVGTGRRLLRRRAQRHALVHLARALPNASPEERLRIVRASARLEGAAWAEWKRMRYLRPAERIRRYGLEALEAPVRKALEARTGAIVVTARFGPWEGIAAGLAAATGDTMLVCRRPASSHAWASHERFRLSYGVRSCTYSSSRVDALRWLRQNRLLVILADDDAGRDGVFLPFFGVPASVLPLAADLAAETGAPCLAALCLREGGARRLDVLPLDASPGAPPEARRRTLSQWLTFLEARVRARPEDYVWSRRRWRTRPLRAVREEAALR